MPVLSSISASKKVFRERINKQTSNGSPVYDSFVQENSQFRYTGMFYGICKRLSPCPGCCNSRLVSKTVKTSFLKWSYSWSDVNFLVLEIRFITAIPVFTVF